MRHKRSALTPDPHLSTARLLRVSEQPTQRGAFLPAVESRGANAEPPFEALLLALCTGRLQLYTPSAQLK